MHDHVRWEQKDSVAVLWLDQPDAGANKLSPAWLDDLQEALDRVRNDTDVRAAVLISAKPDSFVVGADLAMLKELDSPSAAQELSRRAHRMVTAFQSLDKPTVAAIHGPAMGGGLELALACSYRIATDAPETRLACPEVRLGLIPGAGGTQTLPRLVGLPRGLNLLLTGRNTYAARALRWGLVNALIHPPGLLTAAIQAARALADGDHPGRSRQESLTDRLLESTSLSRQMVYKQAEKETEEETRGNYSAPPDILECVRIGMEDGLEAGLEMEARRFAQALFRPESRALVDLFFAKQEAEKNPFDGARTVHRIGVLGSGLMGAGIGTATAQAGVDVVILDRDLPTAMGARRLAWKEAGRRVGHGEITPFERDRIQERIVPTDRVEALEGVQLVIEAVPEDKDLKLDLLGRVDAVLPEDAVLASNTSSIPIGDLASCCKRPERMLGMHYFSPVGKIPLIELVRTGHTREEALATAYALALRQGKTPIVVRDSPGFYTTRVLALYLNEALLAVEEGAEVETVDEAARNAGFAMGPLEVLDQVGTDVGAEVTRILRPLFEPRGIPLSGLAGRMAEKELLGQKSGAGFYRYKGGKPNKDAVNPTVRELVTSRPGPSPLVPDIQERLLLTFVNEALRCLEEGVLASPTDGDLGAVLGLGFPPFLGGPFHYVEHRTPLKVVQELEILRDKAGDRFEPCDSLRERVRG